MFDCGKGRQMIYRIPYVKRKDSQSIGTKAPVRDAGIFLAMGCGASSAMPNLEASVYHDALFSGSAHARELSF